MIPISDDNPARLRPYVTWAIIATCVAVFVWQLGLSQATEDQAITALSFIPARLFEAPADTSALVMAWPWITIVTSMFLHGGLLHIGGNMLYLWIFGNNVEDAFGHGRFFVFYFVCGAAAALCEGAINAHSRIPMLGASGAISGVLAAYLLIFPRARVTVIIPLGILFYPLKISAFYVIGFWFVMQLASLALTPAGTPGVAWFAHVGGFAAGLLLTPMLSHFPLFGRRSRGPWG
jgi:membrane associated rhomboid family serine protease